MLFFVLWPDRGGHASYDAGLARLRAHPAVCAEIRELVALGADAARHVPRPLGPAADVPLLSHAHYRREEILAALGWASMERKAHGHATGVAWAAATADRRAAGQPAQDRARLLPDDDVPRLRAQPGAVPLGVAERHDARVRGRAALRRTTASRGTHVALFVRESPSDELGQAAPFLRLGLVDHVEHRGERPIAITWRLRRPMPAETFQAARVVAS